MTQRIKALIAHLGISTRSFALTCGLRQNTLSNQLNGMRELSLATVKAILDTYPDVSAAWLIKGEGEMFIQPLVTDIDRITALVDTIADLKVAISEKDKTIALLTAEVEKFKLKAP